MTNRENGNNGAVDKDLADIASSIGTFTLNEQCERTTIEKTPSLLGRLALKAMNYFDELGKASAKNQQYL